MGFGQAQGAGSSGGGGTPDDNSVSTAKVQDAAVTLAKMADLAQDKFIGRTTASTGVPEVATITAAARTVLDDTTVGAMLTTLGVTAAAQTVLDDTTVVAMLATMSGVAGVASGYKIARGVASITGSGDVATGLSTVVAAVVSSQSNISAVNLGSSVTIGDQSGSPAAGSITIKVWKATSLNNVTMIAATNAMDYNWIAVGT